MGIASLLAKFGLDVCMIADNESCRPQTKRDSVERAAKREHCLVYTSDAADEEANVILADILPTTTTILIHL